ncbi:bifunctional SulP family inorganic anion transporter/carbonic anhydrase [Streptomyces sp. NPDC015220]|uniref:bifunctional SulP family inorganic anion transporter/carbonic anhydrase n=1 Tax=Streptomyces sp. NPDC015220 TaxID=3364947 RepID=UPI0036FF7725
MSACVPTRATDSARAQDSHPPHSPPPWRRGGRLAGTDLSAAVSVFLIALPLSLGIALATGAPLQAGLVAAAVGGLVAGRFGGSPLQVSGPAAGLTVVTAELIVRYGWRTTCAITVLAQLCLGCLRVARGALAVSPAVVHGMLAGIGVTIAVAQLHIVLGGSPQSSVLGNLRALPGQLVALDPAALAVSALTLVLLLLWPRLPGGPGRLLRSVPAALVAVVGATTVASLTGLALTRVDLPSWRTHALAELPDGPSPGLATAVLGTTLVCSVQSLLGAVAVDKLVAGRSGPAPRVRRSNLDRELLGQGAANVVSGALGGLPVAGVAVRSSANVRAGAVSRNSTMLHGVFVVVAALLMVPVLELIPLASLAALVMAVGIQMVSPHHIRTVTRHREVLVYAVTALGVVAFGVLGGVVLGIATAVAVALHRLARTRITHDERAGAHYVRVRGQLTFLAVPRLSRTLHMVPQGADVVVELDGSFMDHAAYESLHDWQRTHTAQGGSVELTGRRAGVGSGVDRKPPTNTDADGGTGPDTTAMPTFDTGPGATPRPGSGTGSGADTEPGSGMVTNEPEDPGSRRRGRRSGFRSARGSGLRIGRGPSPEHLPRGVGAFRRSTAPPPARSEPTGPAQEVQQPSKLFRACADSRLITSLIIIGGPSDLFVVRNVGNLVPPPGDGSGIASVVSGIEYAVDVLGACSISMCGHSGCGAMRRPLASDSGGPAHRSRGGGGTGRPPRSGWPATALPDSGRPGGGPSTRSSGSV